MISAVDPFEFVPTGRKIVVEHCSLNKKAENLTSEFILLDRLRNVNLSAEEQHNESWTLREIQKTASTGEFDFLSAPVVNSEEELYFSGHTCVWSKGRDQLSSEICYTTETPIQFAFFCTKNFLDPDHKNNGAPTTKKKHDDTKELEGIGIINTGSLKVYCKNGENYITSIETPISKIWMTKHCLLIEKEASTDLIDGHPLPMPRIFSLKHPLDDMYPVLLKVQLLVSYITEDEYKIIFAMDESDLVLMFNTRTGRHTICKIRKATEEETTSVTGLYDTTMGHSMSSVAGFTSVYNNSLRAPKNLSGRHTPNSLNPNHLSFHNSMSGNYRSSLKSFADYTSHKNSISMMARKIGECEPSKPLVPDLIFEQIWTENTTNWNEYNEMATKGFHHMDFIGQQYLCFLLPKSFKLNLLQINRMNNVNAPVFGATSSISAKDAVALPKMNMIVVLLPCGTLMIYSGPVSVGKIHVGGLLTNLTVASLSTPAFPKRSSILPNIASPVVDMKLSEEFHMLSPVHPLQNSNPNRLNNCVSLKDPIWNRVTLAFSSGKMYRIELPQMCENPLIRKILISLRQILPKEALKVLVKWYSVKNSPGTKDISLKREFEMFKNLLLEMMGRPHEVSHSSSSSAIVDPKKRRKSENGTDTDWEFLLNINNSHPTKSVENDDDDHEMLQNYHADSQLFPFIPIILYTLHLLYEDLKLDLTMGTEITLLSELLCQLAVDFKLENFRFHYIKDNACLTYIRTKREISINDSEKLLKKELINEPLNIFEEISKLAIKSGTKEVNKYPFIPNINCRSHDIFELLAIIFGKTDGTSQATKLVTFFNEKEPPTAKIFSVPNPSVHKLVIEYMLKKNITRKDLDRLPVVIHYIISQTLEAVRLGPPLTCSAEAYKLLLRPELYTHATFKNVKKTQKNNLETSLTPRIKTQPDVIAKSEKSMVEDDGMEHMDTKLLRLRFPDDLRINDVRKFLNSSKPVTIDIVQSPNMSDHEFIEEQEKQLFSLCTRTMALPVGRGMFTYRTFYPVLTEILPMPKLCLNGKETVRGSTVEFQQIEVPANMSLWPQFHNGVASALRIATDPSEIDPAYILYNKPKEAEMPPSYAGFLMALGLTSSLKSLSDPYIYEFLIKSEELLSVGLILGMAASYRGTMNTKITRMLSVHIESLLPPTAIELDVPHNVQVASLLGIGLLYQNSNKRYVAEALLQEINRPPGPEMENYVERESYALSAGLALGMVCLESGNKDVGLDDLNIADSLHYYMIGGTKRALTGTQREKYKLPSFQIREGDQVNIDVTAPGSTLALGLMFFASGNEAVAEWMKPPETMFLLDFVRPDLLLLRVIARGLIMWNTVEPTAEWINSQISKTLSNIIKQRPDPDNDPYDLDHEAICQSYCNIVTGAAMVIGLRYAGTENLLAFKTLKKIITFFFSASGQYIGEYAGKATVESCIILVLIALSLVFAGTGNLEILRMIRMTRARIGPQHSSVTYGSHMAIHMALGFLFLGGGRYTISRRPQAIAALVCALFPKFPAHSNDNRYHLQALRHLYVLAVEPRLFLPRDLDTGKLVVCKLSYIEFNQKSFIETMAPCILPELDTLKAVHINDVNYWPIVFERGRNWNTLIEILKSNECVDIVQKAGCLSHLDDPNRLKSLLAQTLTTEKFSTWRIEPANLMSFYNNDLMTNLTKMLMPLMDKTDSSSRAKKNLQDAMLLQIYDCLTKDKTHALGIYISIDNIIEAIVNKTEIKSTDVWQLKILSTIMHYKSLQINPVQDQSSCLLSHEILRSLLAKVNIILNERLVQQKHLVKQFFFSKDLDFLQDFCVQATNELMLFAIYYDLPLNLFGEALNIGGMNLLQFLVEFKKRDFKQKEPQFISNLWKILST